MMPSRSCNGVRPEAERYCFRSFEIFLTTSFSNVDGLPYGWLPMGSPGVFIHCGTLGGRFSELSAAADALLPARPPATTAPPTSAPPSRRNRRRDVATRRLPASAGSVIAATPLAIGHTLNNPTKLRYVKS